MSSRFSDLTASNVQAEPFGVLPDGQTILAYSLRNRLGQRVRILTYGATMQSFETPDSSGRMADILLGHNTLDGYRNSQRYFGAVVGRFANRIANGRFSLDGTDYQLSCNQPPHALHGGDVGFDQAVWTVDATGRDDAGEWIQLSHVSPDGDQGYPGAVDITVTYSLDHYGSLSLQMAACATAPTPINPVAHPYWNLGGEGSGSIHRHILQIESSAILPVTDRLIPTGSRQDVAGSVFDFRIRRAIGDALAGPAGTSWEAEQRRIGKGLDHCFCLSSQRDPARDPVLRLSDPQSRRLLTMWTTEPAVQIYTGNYLAGAGRGKSGRVYQDHDGVAIEAQHFPDSPNHPDFPSTILRPGERFSSRTRWQVGIMPAG